MSVDPKILAQIKKVTNKRPLAVINHLLKHGQVTTEELREQYGYEHAPRARMDVLEWGYSDRDKYEFLAAMAKQKGVGVREYIMDLIRQGLKT